jgi:hypothetical protein
MKKWYVIAKWINPQSGNVHRHTFRAEGNTIQQGIEAAVSEAAQLWSCKRDSVIVYDVGQHVSLAEMAEAEEQDRHFNRGLIADVIYTINDVDDQVEAILALVKKGAFR